MKAKPKKSTGKGHTLFEDDLPKSPTDVWLLISESCLEISRTLLAQDSFAGEMRISMSGYAFSDPSGGVKIIPASQPRYSAELYLELWEDAGVHALIEQLLPTVRRIQLHVICDPFVPVLFQEDNPYMDRHELLERVRTKAGASDIIGCGMEGFKTLRIRTYTPKRADEIKRAFRLLKLKPHIFDLLPKTSFEARAVGKTGSGTIIDSQTWQAGNKKVPDPKFPSFCQRPEAAGLATAAQPFPSSSRGLKWRR